MSGACLLRPPAPGDCEHVVRRHGALYADEYGWDDTHRELVEGIVADYRSDVAPGRQRMWIAEVGGEIAGAIMAVPATDRPESGQLRCLYVEPPFRGRGIGSTLVRACVTFCRDAGYRTVVLWTMQHLIAAHRLYVGAGFAKIEETPRRAFGHDLVAEIWELDLAPLPIRLRPATHDDLEFLRTLHDEAMRPHVERTWGAWDAADQKKRFYATTDPSTHEIIELRGEPVGCCWVRRHPDALELVRLYVMPAVQGRGIGTHMVRRLLSDARRSGLRVRLRVMKVNPAQRLYRRLGFAVTGESETHYTMEG